MNRRDFIVGCGGIAAGLAASAGAEDREVASNTPIAPTEEESLKVKFVGSGSACWEREPRTSKICRRYSSILVDNRFLIDYTWMGADMLPEGFAPKAIVYTHSHPDHYDPKAAVKLGVKHVFLSRTWAEDAKKEFAAAAEKLGLPAPEIHPTELYRPFTLGRIYEILPLPGNHWTGRLHEQAQIYVVKKLCRTGAVRLLYATDTSGLPSGAFFGGIVKEPLTGVIMEATGQPGRKFDGLQISHSTADTVNNIFTSYLKPKKPGEKGARYTPPEGQPVYLTHIGYYEWGQRLFEDLLPKGLAVAFDGLEVDFRVP